MSKPKLTIIAGCNGSGKSSFSKYLVKSTIAPFDFDLRQKEIYDSFKFDFEIREEMSRNRTIQEFETLVNDSLINKTDFSYETNYNIHPLVYAEKFKAAEFQVNLIYFCLSDTIIAKERVAIRVNNGGHFVSDREIDSRFKQGYDNFEKTFSYFDHVQVFDTSEECEKPREIAFLANLDPIRRDKDSWKKFSPLLPSLSKYMLK
jgi:predicted ABC-type ATPase